MYLLTLCHLRQKPFMYWKMALCSQLSSFNKGNDGEGFKVIRTDEHFRVQQSYVRFDEFVSTRLIVFLL